MSEHERRYPVLVDGQQHVECEPGERIPVPAGACELEVLNIRNNNHNGHRSQTVTVGYLRAPNAPEKTAKKKTAKKKTAKKTAKKKA